MAAALFAAVIMTSCGRKLREAEVINLDETPVQMVEDMFAVQTKDGKVLQRIEAPMMQKFDYDTVSFDCFPNGISVFSYTSEGLLESTITAAFAKHETQSRKFRGKDIWEAYGNVVIKNVIKQETMETDTLYWDRENEEIYTDCFVKMYSPDGLMQGYGMRSDDRARNSTLLRPFDSFGYSVQDTTATAVDSTNFIGPLIKN